MKVVKDIYPHRPFERILIDPRRHGPAIYEFTFHAQVRLSFPLYNYCYATRSKKALVYDFTNKFFAIRISGMLITRHAISETSFTALFHCNILCLLPKHFSCDGLTTLLSLILLRLMLDATKLDGSCRR